jgi:hypothetical protein
MATHRREMAIGLGLGLAGLAFAPVLSSAQRTVFYGLLLAAVGAVYIGFAIADGRASAFAVQAVSASAFVAIAYLGVTRDAPALIGAGWLAHAVWDAIHHEGHGPTEVRTWYPPFCAMADLVIGIPLVTGLL